MENAIQVFDYNGASVRTVEIDGEPWLVGKDVAEVLGYSNTKDAINAHVDTEDRRILQRSENATFDIPPRGLSIINESGFYSLVLSSKLPTAREFKRWVTSEVLPSIRKHRAYMTPDAIEEALSNPDFIIRLATELKAEREKVKALTEETEEKTKLIGELQPKADYCDQILAHYGTLTITAIAKDYGMTAVKMNALLKNLGVQFRHNDTWFLKSDYSGQGYTHSYTCLYGGQVRVHTLWTQKGRMFLYEFLKKHGVLPECERESA